MLGGIATSHADREGLSYRFGVSQQVGNRLEGPTHVVGIKTCEDDLFATVGELPDDLDQSGPNKVCLINADNLGTPIEPGEDFLGRRDGFRWHSAVVVGNDFLGRVPGVDGRLEDLNSSARNHRTTEAPHQFLAFAGEHRTADHLDPSNVARQKIHMRTSRVSPMAFRTRRYIEPEWLDDESPERAAPSIQDLVRINRFLGGHRVLRDALTRCFRPRDPFTMLDVGAASGDAAAVVRAAYPRATVVSLDYRVSHLDTGSKRCVAGNAFALPFRRRSFDFVYCGLFLHHFPDDEVAALLRSFAQISRGYVAANDLERHILPYWFIPATRWLFRWDPITVHDAPVSVQAAFSRTEFRELAVRAGLQDVNITVYRPAFRLCLLAKSPL